MTVAKGRPRDARIDEAVLRATRELIAEQGFSATTIQGVARRAGVGAPAIYRRWKSRLDLILTATSSELDSAAAFEPTGDLRADIDRVVDAYRELFSRPGAIALPGVLAEYAVAPGDVTELVGGLARGVRPAFRAILAAAGPAVDPQVDPDSVLDLLIGACLYRGLIHPLTGRATQPGDITDLIVRSLRP